MFSRLFIYLLFLFTCANDVLAEENFLLINGLTAERVLELGARINERVTPCSTFKIALSLMGYDAGILEDEMTPIWVFQDCYDDFLEVWKISQTPHSWMKSSCVWYSRLLATGLGKEKIQSYLALFEYGNQDMSGGVAKAWITSSLKISPKEQVNFIQKMVREEIPVSRKAVEMTKVLLFIDELPDRWKLYGKTGWSGSIKGLDDESFEIGWFAGWIEKDHNFFPFAYNICESKINLADRIPRVKQLLAESNVMAD